MRSSVQRFGHVLVTIGLTSLVAGPLWVALTGAKIPPGAAALIAIVSLAIVVWRAAPACRPVATFLATRPWYAAAAAIAIIVAATMTVRLAGFVYDPEHREWSAQPHSAFYSVHACLTNMTEALHRAWRAEDVYAEPARTAIVDGFAVDPYQYSPPILLVPAALTMVADDFTSIRRMWFGIQAIAALIALLIVARYVGGIQGITVMWAIPIIWLTPPFLLTLQIANPQFTTLAAAMVGMVWLSSRRPIAGSALVAGAILCKVFPAVLLAYLVGLRRWRSIGLVLGWCALFSLVTLICFGTAPFRDYLHALPQIMRGDVTANWTADLALAPSNQSVYGATRKLVALGLGFVTPRIESAVQSVYGVAIMGFALIAAVVARRKGGDRQSSLRHVIVWLALLNLASFRSPFLPDGYAYVGTLWLGTLLFASIPRMSWPLGLVWIGAWILLSPIYGGRALTPQPFKLIVLVTLVTQAMVGIVTLYAAWTGRVPLPIGSARLSTTDAVGGLAA